MKQNTWRIYLYRQLIAHRTKLKFLVVGCVGFACNSIILLIATHLGIQKVLAEIISVILSLQVTFFLHDRWTYVIDRKNHVYLKSLSKRYVLYLGSNSFGSAMTVVMFSILSLFSGNLLSLAIASGIAMFWNYFINKLVIWRQIPPK